MKLFRIVLFLFILFSFFLSEAQELKPKLWKENYTLGVDFLEQDSVHLALPYLKDAYLIAEATYKPKPKFGKSLYQFYKASIIQNKFDYIDSLQLNKEILSYSKTLRGKKQYTFSKQIGILADELLKKNRFDSSITLYKEQQAILDKNGIINDSTYVRVLFGLGKGYKGTLKNNLEAKKYLEEALLKLEGIPESNSLTKDIVLIELVPIYIQLGNMKEANEAVEDLIKYVENKYGRYSQKYSSTLTTVANIYRVEKMFNEAYNYQKLSLDLFDKLDEDDKDYYQYALANYILALIEKGRNNYRESILLMERSYQTLLDLNDKNYNGVIAVVLGNISLNYDRIGNFEKAVDYIEEAIKLVDKGSETYSIRTMDKAYYYQNMGQYELSHKAYKDSKESMLVSHGVKHQEYAKLLNNIGKLYFEEGNYSDALNYFKDALTIVEVPEGEKWHDFYGYMLNDYAKTMFRLGNTREAIGLMEKNLDYSEKHDSIKSEAYFNRKYNLAKAYNLTKAYNKALPLIEEATKNLKTILGENHVDYGQFLEELSGTYLGLGDTEKAIVALAESNSVFINQIDKIFQFSSENEKKAFIKMVTLNFNKLQSLAITKDLKNDNLNALNLNNQLMLKGLLLNNSKDVLLKLKQLNDDEINSKITSYKFLKSKHAKVLTQSFNKRTLDIDSLTKIINTKEAELVRLYNSNFKEGAKLVRNWEEVKRQLKPNEFAIEFSHFNVIENHKYTDKIRYVAYVVGAYLEFPIMVDLFEERELEQITRRKKPNQLYSNSHLYNLIWEPLANYLPINSTIYYSPSGLLNQIAFVAIKKDNKNLVELYDLNQLSSTYKLTEQISAISFDTSLLVGGINYEYELTNEVKTEERRISYADNHNLKKSRGSKSRGESWTKLEGTISEMQSIKTILNTKSQVSTLTDSNATESNFKALSGDSPNIIHIATHGYFFEKYNQVAEDTGLSMEDQYRLADDPLLRSGLILAGANYAWKNGYNPPNEVEDGILTALEISNLDLSNTDLVVLSACKTGLGDIDGSEGVYGLQRAFKKAGVDRLIMSLWEVPDEETSLFMITFYNNWTKGKSIRDAFIDTQRQMQKSQPNNPEAWAAFVLFE
ncbi:CHAT domain-containing protein [Winogradskyella sp. A2]|uniref:CHAT domain-containing protein n=1 Tax=Winogradskyella sp. A2 TaxID=3366944 RepID=UPI00398C51E5